MHRKCLGISKVREIHEYTVAQEKLNELNYVEYLRSINRVGKVQLKLNVVMQKWNWGKVSSGKPK